jgi:purine-binding chemotaxis protein CheW
MNRASAAVDPRTRVVAGEQHEFVSITVAGQHFGIPVLQVQDVLGPQRITPIPLAPPEVAGSLNLRGRIVTAIDLRKRLKLPAEGDPNTKMSIVVEHRGDLYSFLVDGVGEVLRFDEVECEANPSTLEQTWREVSSGIYRLPESLLVVLDVQRLLAISPVREAA